MNIPSSARVLVAGSANLDYVVRAPHIPAPGETVLGGAFATFPGGKGANQAVACARAGGADTSMLVALGEDAPGAQLHASLAGAGVEVMCKRTPELPSGVAFICISDEAENAITVAPGANTALAPADLSDLHGYSHLLLQLETPIATVTDYARRARQAGLRVVLNAAPAPADPLPAALLESVDILVVNEGELAQLAGDGGSIAEAAARLGVPCVVVTLGAAGCVASDGGEWLAQAAFAIDAVDTTAAGDTFCGVLVAALARGAALPSALREASAASALACTRAGAQSSIPGHADVSAFLDAHPATASAERLLARCLGPR